MNYKWGNSKFNCPRIKWFKIMFHKFLKGPRGKEEENTWNKAFSPNNKRRERNGLLSLEEGLIQRQKNNSTHKRWEMRLSLMSDSFRTIPYQRYALFTPTGEPRFTDSPDRYLYLFMSSCSVLVQISVTLWVFWEQVSDLSRNSNHFLLHKHQQVMLDTHPGKQWSGHAAITAVVSPNNICAFEWEMSYVNLYFLCNMYVKESCRVPGLEEVQEVQQKWIKNIMIMIIMIANITYQCDIPVVYFLCVPIIFQAIVVVHF